MTLKQVLTRYLKDIGLYGLVFNHFYYSYCNRNYARCSRFIYNCSPNELFWYVCKAVDAYNIRWTYRNKTLYELVSDWCEPMVELKRGDIITAVTQDGKYEFNYTVRDMWLSTLEVELEGGHRLSINRISKVNGKKCDLAKGWKFRKEIIK